MNVKTVFRKPNLHLMIWRYNEKNGMHRISTHYLTNLVW